jgi:prevent-host-death family protein
MWLNIAMKTVKIAELKNHLSEHLRAVEGGAELVVTDRDRPIARIVPHSRSDRRVQVKRPTRSFSSVRDKRYAPARWRINSTKLLLEERQQR